MRAHRYQRAPAVGWRSSNRRHDMISPPGSSPSPLRADAASRTSSPWSTPPTRATYRRRSIGCIGGDGTAVPCAAVVSEAPADLELAPLNGKSRPLPAWVGMFHLVLGILDPFTSESAWLLETVARIFRSYDQADCRVAIVATCTPDEARQFLGPYAAEFLTFADPNRETVTKLRISRLPALVHIRQDCSIAGASAGWNPDDWREIAGNPSHALSWP